MPCFDPVPLWRRKDGKGGTQSLRQRDPGAPDIHVACRNCVGCILDARRDLSIRGALEAQLHQRSCFLTLTLADEHYPEDGSVRIGVLQKVMQDVRNTFRGQRIGFMGCGEYGSLNWRAHYHLILLGEDFAHDRRHVANSDTGYPIYKSPTLERIWPWGHADIGTVTMNSAGYVSAYTGKKVSAFFESQTKEQYYERLHPVTKEIVSLRPEFFTSSRRPAIGLSWLNKYESDVFPCDNVVINGRKFTGMPRYFTRKLKEKIEGEALSLGFTEETFHHYPRWVQFAEMIEAREARMLDLMRTRPEEFLPERIEVKHAHAYLTKLSRLEKVGI